ncbi:MAG: sulfate ABC transporter permease subunit CysW [bacterium]
MQTERNINEPLYVRVALTALALTFLLLFLFMPLAAVFYNALLEGLGTYRAAVTDPTALSAIALTFIAVIIAVPLNVIFGVLAAWAITKFNFRGKNILITIIDLPLTVSPVISGTIFILLFGTQGLLGPWLLSHNIKFIFALPGIIIATTFVTLPYVARELIPLMHSMGDLDEEAAITLGAGGLKTFLWVTLPNIKWGLFYGVILTTARAIGEFGAVSVVSGHIRGKTVTMPLHVEILYNEYNFAAAFAVASLLALVSLCTLCLKKFAEWKRHTTALEHEAYLFQERRP